MSDQIQPAKNAAIDKFLTRAEQEGIGIRKVRRAVDTLIMQHRGNPKRTGELAAELYRRADISTQRGDKELADYYKEKGQELSDEKDEPIGEELIFPSIFETYKPASEVLTPKEKALLSERPELNSLEPLRLPPQYPAGYGETTTTQDLSIAEQFGGIDGVIETLENIEANLKGHMRLITEFYILVSDRAFDQQAQGNQELAELYARTAMEVKDRILGEHDEEGYPKLTGYAKTQEQVQFFYRETN